jgi:uncharacterized protein YndB with AHSA1/START domain
MAENEIAEARVEHRFEASAERVFDSWLDPALIRRWMSASLQGFGLPGDVRRVEIDPRVGGRFTFSDVRDAGEAVHWGTYLEIDRPRKLVFTWFASEEDAREGASVVTLTIDSDRDGCIATIAHRMDAKWAGYVPQTEQGWGGMLRASAALLARQP